LSLAEIDKFLLIGNGSFLPDGDDSASYRSEDAEANAVDLRFHDSCSCNSSGKQISSSSVEHQVVSLTEKIKKLESKLEELQGVIAIKNSRIAELETTFTGGEFAEEESACNIGFLDEKFKELKSELERFFQQKIETEIKYLTIKKMMQNLKVASALAEKQKPMSGSEVQIPKLEEAGNEDPIMKNITDEELVHQVMRIRRLKKLAFGILIIFLCLILVLQVIVWELMPNSEVVVVVPT
jgi:chromosome segregation ATPase